MGLTMRERRAVDIENVHTHPQATMEPGQEWLTQRELRVDRLESTQLKASELLSAREIEDLMKRSKCVRRTL